MHKFILVAAISAIPFTAHADNFGPKPNETLINKVHAVCTDATLVKSDAVKAACTLQAFPSVTSKGDAFSNRGLGAELNTLIRNLKG
jgi:hypothetical protein